MIDHHDHRLTQTTSHNQIKKEKKKKKSRNNQVANTLSLNKEPKNQIKTKLKTLSLNLSKIC